MFLDDGDTKKSFLFHGNVPLVKVLEKQGIVRTPEPSQSSSGGNPGLKIKIKIWERAGKFSLWHHLGLLMSLKILVFTELLWALFETRFYFLSKRARPPLPEG